MMGRSPSGPPRPQALRRHRFDSFEPRYTVDRPVLEDLRRIERADERLRGALADPVEAGRLAGEALIRNAFGTASIEGSPLRLQDMELLLADRPTPGALRNPEKRQVLNYVDHMERLPDAPPPADADAVAELHGTLFAGVLPDAGRFKDRPNFVAYREDLTYVPALPERVRPELEQAMAWFQDAPEHCLLRIGILFHEIQGIQPFRDGNGPTGRALAAHQLLFFGYPGVRLALIDERINADRERYYRALQEVEAGGNDFTPWIRYWVGLVRETFEDAVWRATFQRELPAGLNDRQVRIAQWFARLARDSPERRVRFGDVRAGHPTIPERTLRRDLAALVDAAVLRSEGRLKGTTYRMRAGRDTTGRPARTPRRPSQ